MKGFALAITNVVTVTAFIERATGTGCLTVPTTDQRPEQVLVGFIVAAGEAFILRQTCLGQVKDLLADDGWNMRHENPVLWRQLLHCLMGLTQRVGG